ncbi:MAG: STN domain-containing protein, partial [Bacteroidota bacterium]|nr:STN domain-containing protein [Bacteroidota bacterium]
MQITVFCKKEPFGKLIRFVYSHLKRVIKFIDPGSSPVLLSGIDTIIQHIKDVGEGITETIQARRIKQIILKMKITVAILLVACLQVSASGYAQKITISKKNAPVEQVLKEIKKQTGYLFFYNQDWLKQVKSVNIDVKKASIDEVLDICFYNQPVDYSIVDRTIILSRRELFVPKIENLFKQEVPPHEVKGKVTDTRGETLPGVSVR